MKHFITLPEKNGIACQINIWQVTKVQYLELAILIFTTDGQCTYIDKKFEQQIKAIFKGEPPRKPKPSNAIVPDAVKTRKE